MIFENGVDLEIIPREDYLRWLREFRDKPIIKVVTGLRRAGKSTILDLFMRELVDSGIAARQILSINFEEMENEPYLDRHKLYERIMSAKGAGERLYVFFVVQGDDGCPKYIQVAVSVKDEDKLKQELAVFKHVKNNYPKYIFTMDQVFVPDHEGVRTISVYDFLLGNDF